MSFEILETKYNASLYATRAAAEVTVMDVDAFALQYECSNAILINRSNASIKRGMTLVNILLRSRRPAKPTLAFSISFRHFRSESGL